MRVNRFISAAIVASLLCGISPLSALAEERAAESASVDLRAAINRAAVRLATDGERTPARLASRAPAKARQGPAARSGGGGKSTLIWTLVSTAASIGATYYIVKEVKKQTEQLSQQ